MRRESFATPGPVELLLGVPAGRIELETLETGETVIELEPLRDDEASVAAVESARVEMRERAAGGQQVTVSVDEAAAGIGFSFGRGASDEQSRRFRFGFWRTPEVLVRVRCPQGASVEAQGGSSDVEGRGSFGSVEVTTGSGDISFDHVEGAAQINGASGDVGLGHVEQEARINTASGDIEIRHAEGGGTIRTASGDVAVRNTGSPLSVQTASGDVIVHRAEASLDIATASGDQRVDDVGGGDVSMKSASGDIYVAVRRGTKLWMDARSRSGDASSDLDVGDDPPPEGAPVLELRATSMSGDVRITRASSTVERTES